MNQGDPIYVIPVSGPIAPGGAAAPSVLGGGTAHIGNVGGDTFQATATFTCPAGTAQYTTGDAVADSATAATAMNLANCARQAGGAGYITAVALQKNGGTVLNAAFRVHFYTATPSAISGDNLPFSLKWADRGSYLGAADLVMRTEAGGSTDMAFALDDARRIPFTCAAGTADLKAVVSMEATTGYLPPGGEVFVLGVTTERS